MKFKSLVLAVSVAFFTTLGGTVSAAQLNNSNTNTPGQSQSLVGDINQDGNVDVSDLSILLSNWDKRVKRHANCDLNTDGSINILDLSVLLSNYGKTN